MQLVKLALFAGVAASSVTPVQKVIQLMDGMLAKGKADKAEEGVIYKEYSDWVHDQARDTSMEIKDLKAKIEKLSAIRDKADADADAFTTELASLNKALAGFESELAAATKLRGEEKEAFVVNQKDLSESVDALDRAIMVMKKRDYDIEANSFLQKLAVAVPKAAPELTAFLQDKAAQPQAKEYSYEFQSGGIVELLKKLNKKFSKELYDAQTAEANSVHNYQLMKMNLDDEIAGAKASIEDRTQKKSEAQATSAGARRQLADSNSNLAASQKYLADVKTTFTLKTNAYETNQVVRSEEIEALTTAIEIISGGAVSGAADKHLPSFAQTAQKKAISFLQIREKTMTRAKALNVIKQVSQMLQDRNASEFGNKSKFLSLAAFQMLSNANSASGTKGPFDKVIGLIEDMLTRLQEEAAGEAEHKKFCDEELKGNKLNREKLTSSVDSYTAKKNQLAATVAQLATEIANLEAAEAALNKAMGEATEQRNKEHAKNTATVADAKAAQEALSQALGVLREFYNKNGGDVALVQQVPEMKAYAGQQAAKGGVVGMLEVIQSDFARLEADTTATENQAQQEYDQFMTDATADAKAKHQDAFDKKLLKDQTEHKHHMTVKDLTTTQSELDAALNYQEQLRNACTVQKVSYEERVKMREEEIASLREALQILEDSTADI